MLRTDAALVRIRGPIQLIRDHLQTVYLTLPGLEASQPAGAERVQISGGDAGLIDRGSRFGRAAMCLAIRSGRNPDQWSSSDTTTTGAWL